MVDHCVYLCVADSRVINTKTLQYYCSGEVEKLICRMFNRRRHVTEFKSRRPRVNPTEISATYQGSGRERCRVSLSNEEAFSPLSYNQSLTGSYQ